MTSAPVVVVASERSCEVRATELAAVLKLPLVTTTADEERPGDLVLEVTPERVQLRAPGSGPVFLDFAGGRVYRRRHEAGLYRTPLARALGVTRTSAPFVFDATAGLGTDSALLVWMGCQVLAVERSPILAVLWRDALERFARAAPQVAARLSFSEGDASELLRRIGAAGEGRPDVVYLDPMFPPRSKSALVKKEMQVLHALHGESSDDESAALLTLARETATKRVVIKRPRGKPPLAPGVTHAHEGSTTRLDVYVVG